MLYQTKKKLESRELAEDESGEPGGGTKERSQGRIESHEGYHTELGNGAQSSAELGGTHLRTVPLKDRKRWHSSTEARPLLAEGYSQM